MANKTATCTGHC